MSNEPEKQVRKYLADGDTRTAATLAIRTCGPAVLRYLRAMLHDEDDIKDAFSDWAELLWRELTRFRWESAIQTWAFGIAYRVALRLHDQAWRRRRRRLETCEASHLAATLRTASAVRLETRHAILQGLRQELSLADQTLLALRVDQGLSWNEIARVLGGEGAPSRPGTIAKRFERLKTRLSERLRRDEFLD